jgi:hypothetical protein
MIIFLVLQPDILITKEYVSKTLEHNYKIIEKGFMNPIIDKLFPVYTHFKPEKQIDKWNTIIKHLLV